LYLISFIKTATFAEADLLFFNELFIAFRTTNIMYPTVLFLQAAVLPAGRQETLQEDLRIHNKLYNKDFCPASNFWRKIFCSLRLNYRRADFGEGFAVRSRIETGRSIACGENILQYFFSNACCAIGFVWM